MEREHAIVSWRIMPRRLWIVVDATEVLYRLIVIAFELHMAM